MPPDVSHYFDGRDPALREIYERLLAAVARFGPVTVDPKKGSIHLDRKSAFAEVVVRKESLILAFKAAGDIESPRIIKRILTAAALLALLAAAVFAWRHRETLMKLLPAQPATQPATQPASQPATRPMAQPAA